MAFARIDGRDAVIVVAARLFDRASESGRRWPDAQAWQASLVLGSRFREVRVALAAAADHPGSTIAVGPLFGVLPVAVLQAQCTPRAGRKNKAKPAAMAV